jgi:hypothetical protein
MAWRSDLHPRDAKGRFANKGSLPAVSIAATMANLRAASDDDLMDVFHRLSARKILDKRALAAMDTELARREGIEDLTEATASPEQTRVDELVRRGWSYPEAYAEAYGRSAKRAASQERASLVERQRGESVESARRRAYREMVALNALQAEEATRGNLVTHRCRDVDPTSLWSAPPARARKCASPELLEFWEAHGGRLTYAQFRAQLVGTGAARGVAAAQRQAGAGRDFGL